MSVVLALLLSLRSWARSRAVLQLEVLALRHQLQVVVRQNLTSPNAVSATRAEPAMLHHGGPCHPDCSALDHPGEPTSKSRVREPGPTAAVGGLPSHPF